MSGLVQSHSFKITVYVLVSILIGALLAPPFYWIGRAVYESGALEGFAVLGVDLHDELRRAELPRYFNRAILAGALLALWPLIRWLRVPPSEFLQLRANPNRGTDFGVGFLLGAGGLLLLGWILLRAGVFGPPSGRVPIAELLVASLVSAVCVGLLEEFFFRGCILGLALLSSGRFTALAFASLFFAAVHFLKPPEHLPMPDPVTWGSGFWLVGQIFAQFGNPMFMAAEFTTLFLVGWVLGFTRLRTRSLWLGIGLHAGWVFGIKVYGGLTRRSMSLQETLPWIGKDLKSGLVPVIVVALTGVLTWWWLRRSARKLA